MVAADGHPGLSSGHPRDPRRGGLVLCLRPLGRRRRPRRRRGVGPVRRRSPVAVAPGPDRERCPRRPGGPPGRRPRVGHVRRAGPSRPTSPTASPRPAQGPPARWSCGAASLAAGLRDEVEVRNTGRRAQLRRDRGRGRRPTWRHWRPPATAATATEDDGRARRFRLRRGAARARAEARRAIGCRVTGVGRRPLTAGDAAVGGDRPRPRPVLRHGGRGADPPGRRGRARHAAGARRRAAASRRGDWCSGTGTSRR